MSKLMVQSLAGYQKGQEFEGDFRVSSLQVKLAKNGQQFADFKLEDKSGSIGAKIWGYNAETTRLEEGKVYRFSGKADQYQERTQVIVSGVFPRVSATDEDFDRVSDYLIDEMWMKLIQIVETFKNPWFKQVTEDILLHAGYADDFKRSPAATGMHHAFIGGLLEHTWQMMDIGDTLLRLPYFSAKLNRDLCLFGILMHDFGKIFEYSQKAGFKKTVQGILVPHIPMTGAIIYHTCEQHDVPEVVRDHMMHVVLAHHKLMEYGSPVTFACPEAAFVHYVDNLHGDVFGFVQRIETEGKGKDYVKHGYAQNNLVVSRFSDTLKIIEGAESFI